MPSPAHPIAEMLSGACILLEDRLSDGAAAAIYHRPDKIICCTQSGEIDRAFADIEAGLTAGLHAAGLLSYELGYALEPKLAGRMPADRDTPLLWFGLFQPPQRIPAATLDAFFAGLAPPPPVEDLRYGHDGPTHSRKLQHILDLIRDGDIYQANLTFPISFRYAGAPLSLYAALRSRQPVSYGGFAALGDTTILSVSPELFLDIEGGVATTRPMKGTLARDADAATDTARGHHLRNDPKQRAENLMIVDLLRNDLSRIAEFGTVRVPSLFEVETYPGFLTMSSTITANLRRSTSLRDRIAALFPCGSIVGAPKIRAGEILRDIEAKPRGFYTGALGAIAPNGDMRLNVAIRTAILDENGNGTYGVGGGIVAESRPDDEYHEALLKGQVLTGLAKPYDLIETLCWNPEEGFRRLPNHLDRLTSSARQLGFAIERSKIENHLAEIKNTQLQATTSAQRVRITLSRNGHATITTTALPAPKPGKLRVCLAEARLDPANPFLRHKTSLRETYEIAFARATAAGFDEALFLNTAGDVAEASRNTVFAVLDGKLLTPPLSSGLLPGVLRQTLIQSGKAVEQSLSLTELRNAATLYLGNSLYGLRAAMLVA
jgi:para-aminobenzoate synthetase/4-amino-4-deoxychorismate lyase